MRSLAFGVLVGTSMLALTACSSTSKDLAHAFERDSVQPQRMFNEGQYLSSAKIYFNLANSRRNGNTPLYFCETIPAALLAGEDEKAFKITKRAINLLEGFYNPRKEKEAASFWGREAVKVYKGDPYERSMLYFLYGIQLLERGDVDSAAASFKRSLLLDGDSEAQKYKSDFGLPFFMLAKCNYLQGDIEECRENLQRAFVGACGDESFRKKISDLLNSNRQKYPDSVFPELRDYASIAGRKGFIRGLRLSKTDENQKIIDWLFKDVKSIDELMDFDSVVFLWDGNGPRMAKTGKSGEIRMIVPGRPSYKLIYVDGISESGAKIYGQGNFLDGFGNVNFQGITRGGREMDNVLKSKAAAKQSLKETGDAMIVAGAGAAYSSTFMTNSNAQVGTAAAALLIIAGGAVIDAVSNSVNAEADTRNWRTLPHSLKFYCLKNDQELPITLRKFGENNRDSVKTFYRKNANGPVKFYHAGTQTERWELVEREPIEKIDSPVPANNANDISVPLAGTWKSRPVQYICECEDLINGQWRRSPAYSYSGTTTMTYRFRENGQFERVCDYSYPKNYGKSHQRTFTGTWIRNGNDLRMRYDPQDVADEHLTLHFIDEKTVELRIADVDETRDSLRDFIFKAYLKENLSLKEYHLNVTLESDGSVTKRSLTKEPGGTFRKKTQTSATIIERQ